VAQNKTFDFILKSPQILTEYLEKLSGSIEFVDQYKEKSKLLQDVTEKVRVLSI